MPDDSLAFTLASELRELIDSKQVSIVELTQMFLRQIETLNPKLNAYLTVTGDEALASAHASEQALLRGRLARPLFTAYQSRSRTLRQPKVSGPLLAA